MFGFLKMYKTWAIIIGLGILAFLVFLGLAGAGN